MNLEEAKELFKKHVLKVEHESEELKCYLFHNPQNQGYWQRWVFTNGRLIVTGDCYDSIYYSGAFSSIKSTANCSLSYFSSKCLADRDGHNQSSYDSDKAAESIHELIISNFKSYGFFTESDEIEDKLSAIEKYIEDEMDFVNSDIPRSFDDEWDTVVWIRENTHIVGPDWWDGLNLNKKNNHPYWHLAAIKVAAKQLELVH